MAEHDDLEYDTASPRWLRPAFWVAMPLAVLSCGLAVHSALTLPSVRERTAAETAATSPRRPTQPGATQSGADATAAAIVQLARLRADVAAEEAYVEALTEITLDLSRMTPEALNGDSAEPEVVPPMPTTSVVPPAMPQDSWIADAPSAPPSVPILAFTPVLMTLPAPPEARLPRLHEVLAPPLHAPPVAPPQPPSKVTAVQRPMPADMPGRVAAAGPAARLARAAEPARAQFLPSADPRCGALLARLQLGEKPTDADRSLLQSACAPRR